MGVKYLAGEQPPPEIARDFFYRVRFEVLPDSLVISEGVASYSAFLKNWHRQPIREDIRPFLDFINGAHAGEDSRTRWDRLHFLHLTVILFLNNFGYDFQKTCSEKMATILSMPRHSKYLENYFLFLDKYRLGDNNEVKDMRLQAQKYFRTPPDFSFKAGIQRK
jgi:hypothetical protein